MSAPTRVRVCLGIAVAATTMAVAPTALAGRAAVASIGPSFGVPEAQTYDANTSVTVGSFTEACPINTSLPSHPHDCGQLAATVDSFSWTSTVAGSAVAQPACTNTDPTCTFHVVAHGCLGTAACQPYPELGSYQASYTWEDPATGVPPTTVATQANVSDAPLSDVSGHIGAQEGQVLPGSAFIWRDAGGVANTTYSASTVDWGDGSPPEQVSPLPEGTDWGGITGSHAYLQPGTYNGSVTITDDDGQSVVVRPTIVVHDAPLSVSASPISATEGQVLSGQVATFSDTYAGAVASDFTATVDWNDGSPPSTATVTANPSGGFDVGASHSYAKAGSYAAVVTIKDSGGAAAQATSTVTVADAPLGASGVAVSATESSQFTGPVAKFTDGNPGAVASDFTAIVNWGDGTPQTAGTVTVAGAGVAAASATGRFEVEGAHVYAQPGTFTVTVTITDSAGATATVSAAAQVVKGTLHGTAIAPVATEATRWSGLVLTFTDVRSDAVAGDFTAHVNWGDGSTSPGTVVADASRGFEVDGGHTYAEGGARIVTVTVTDGKTGQALVLRSTATVADQKLTGRGTTLCIGVTYDVSCDPAARFDGTVATFTDADPSAQASDYTATIDWGDGHSDPGTVTSGGSGFAVSGSHTYDASRVMTRRIVVVVRDSGGASVAISSSVTIYPPTPVCVILCGWGSYPVQQGGHVAATVTLPRPAARLTATITYAHGRQTTLLARLVRRNLRAGNVPLRIPLSAGARTIVRKHHRLRVELTVTVTTSSGTATRHRFVTLHG